MYYSTMYQHYQHSLLPPFSCQYRFRSNMSTSHSLLEFVEEIITSIDNNKYDIGIFVDLKNSFDTVKNIIMVFVVLHTHGF